eukprot:749643-Hanusia_phi.AAC.2
MSRPVSRRESRSQAPASSMLSVERRSRSSCLARPALDSQPHYSRCRKVDEVQVNLETACELQGHRLNEHELYGGVGPYEDGCVHNATILRHGLEVDRVVAELTAVGRRGPVHSKSGQVAIPPELLDGRGDLPDGDLEV